jgi:polyferredoxin
MSWPRSTAPPFLIAWDSARNQELLAAGQPANYRLLRPRTLIYAVLVAVVGLAMLAGLGLRSSTDINVLHDRNPLFVTLSDGSIRNGYTIKILNRRHEARLYRLSLAGGLPATYRVVGGKPETSDPVELRAMPDRVSTFQVYVTLPRSAVDRASRAIDFEATDPVAGTTARHTSVFRGPER